MVIITTTALGDTTIDVPDGGADITLALPTNTTLLGISITPRADSPKARVVAVVFPTTESIRFQPLIVEEYTSRVSGLSKPVFWTGEIELGNDFEYTLSASIENLSGATVKYTLAAYGRRNE